MKILKIFTFIISIFLFQNFAFSNFESTSTFVDSEKEFSKIHGEKNILYVHEDYIINPFSQSNIVQNQLNGNTNSYSVDNRIFNSSHPKYQVSSQIYENWKQSEPGVYTMIRLLENTFTRDASNVLMPNQQVTVRKYYKVDFNFDKTPPTGGDLKLYNDQDATQRFTYQNGTWLNQPKYYTMTCNDPETGCKCDFNLTKTAENGWINENNHACTNSTEIIKKGGKVQTVPSIIGHLTKPTAIFENNVNMSDNIEGSINGSSYVMYDQSSPRIGLGVIDSSNTTVKDFYYGSETNREYLTRSSDGKKYDGEQIPGKVYYDIKNTVTLKADQEYKLGAVFMDQYIDNSSNGVSGIKNYSIKVLKKNESNNSYSEIYNYSRSYGVYNSDGSKESNDQKGKILEGLGKLNESGEYRVEMQTYDWAGNHTKSNSNFIVYPESIDDSKVSISSEGSGKYANNSDYYLYKIILRDQYSNPVKNKKVDLIKHDCTGLGNSCNEIKTNQVQKSGKDGLNIFDLSNGGYTDENGQIEVKIRSIAPGQYTNSFLLVLNEWDENYQDTNEQLNVYAFNNQGNEFLKPIEPKEILVSDNGGESWEGKPEIGNDQKYKYQLNNIGGLNGYSNGMLNIDQEKINQKVSGHFWEDFSDIDNNFGNNINNFVGFNGLIDANNSESVLKGPEVESEELEISYNLNNENIKYYLDSLKIQGCSVETLGLKVEGNIQGDGKSEITGQEDNFSDLSNSEVRSQIRSNAYEITSGFTDGKILNGVKYVEGDYVMEANPTYETLVVKNGNLIIDKNINSNDEKLGIIVLKDNYDVNSDYNGDGGNIYIKNDVNYISASIFADGTLRSAKSNGLKYEDSELNEKLELFGTLFTRNTIGGAVLAGENYTIPGGQTTNNYDLARAYDLNYVRQMSSCNDDYSFLIKYNPEVQVNPPRGFSN